MKNVFAIAAIVVFLGLAAPAHAALIDITLGATNATASTYGLGGTLNPNIDLSTYGSLALTGAQILPAGATTSNYTSPSGSLFGNTYLAVLGGSPGGTATFTFAGGNNTLGFTWGTTDIYNTLTLTDSRNVIYTITGQDLINQGFASVNVHGFGSDQNDVTITDPYGTLVSAQLSTTQNSFETGNFGVSDVSSVPLPNSLPLFAAGIIGLSVFARRKARVRAR